MRTLPCPRCYLCRADGKYLIEGLRDLLFDVPGEWRLNECLNPDCGLVWLDPRPVQEDLGIAYDNYYTHYYRSSRTQDHHNIADRLLRTSFKLGGSVLKWLIGVRLERKRLHMMYLDKARGGRLLEVGSGNGRRLRRYRDRGWQVVGQEVDPKAASYAADKFGLPVCVGPLEELELPASSFDAVVMNHVVEHLPDPVKTLKECNRLLKPKGTLVVVTPNIKSFGFGQFESDWRGLEPPRHLHLFSQKTLGVLAAAAGFHEYDVWTTAVRADSFARESLLLGSHGKKGRGGVSAWNIEMKALSFLLRARMAHFFDPSSGEECVLKAVK